jgi:hypothetical protein
MALSEKGPWDLPVGGYEVLEITFAYSLYIQAHGDDGATCTIGLAGEFNFVDPGGQHVFDVSRRPRDELASILGLRHDRLESVHATPAGDLAVAFASGRRLQAGPSPMYENWHISGSGFELIATPGGGVAVFTTE